eukprot:2235153-Pyramimonas_sp.AAC.2
MPSRLVAIGTREWIVPAAGSPIGSLQADRLRSGRAAADAAGQERAQHRADPGEVPPRHPAGGCHILLQPTTRRRWVCGVYPRVCGCRVCGCRRV